MSEANVAKDNFYIVTYEKNSWATPSSQDLMHSRRQYNTTARNKDSVIFEILYNSTPQFSGNPISGGIPFRNVRAHSLKCWHSTSPPQKKNELYPPRPLACMSNALSTGVAGVLEGVMTDPPNFFKVDIIGR